jgi:hypothetical protein
LGTSNSDLKKRNAALDKFLIEISTPRHKAKALKKKIIKEPVYEKGECIIFKLNTGNYGGAMVLEAIYNTEYAWNLIALTTINRSTKPILKDFLNAQMLIINYGAYKDEVAINWFLPMRYQLTSHLFERIGRVEVKITYDRNKIDYGACADYDIYLIEVANKQFEYELLNGKSKKILSVKSLIKKPIWKLW